MVLFERRVARRVEAEFQHQFLEVKMSPPSLLRVTETNLSSKSHRLFCALMQLKMALLSL